MSACLDLDQEVRVIAMVKALTDYIESRGFGMFLSELAPEWAVTRALIYRDAGIEGYTATMDHQAATRLKLWWWKIREHAE